MISGDERFFLEVLLQESSAAAVDAAAAEFGLIKTGRKLLFSGLVVADAENVMMG